MGAYFLSTVSMYINELAGITNWQLPVTKHGNQFLSQCYHLHNFKCRKKEKSFTQKLDICLSSISTPNFNMNSSNDSLIISMELKSTHSFSANIKMAL
jgi:hypothetical protein